jgi:hypothetical protein
MSPMPPPSPFVTHEEFTRIRHDANNRQSVDDARRDTRISELEKTRDDVLLTKQAVTVMNDKLSKIETKLDKFIESADTKYVDVERMSKVEEEIIWQRRTIIIGSIMFILATVISMAFTYSLAQ